jgi:hypothetical protein
MPSWNNDHQALLNLKAATVINADSEDLFHDLEGACGAHGKNFVKSVT